MSTNGCPPMTVNMTPLGGLFGTQHTLEVNSESSDNCSRTATGEDRHCGKPTNQYHLPQGYGYPPPLRPFAGYPQFYHHFSFNMRHSTQPTTSASKGYPSYRPQWQGYDLHQGGNGGYQMFPPPQLAGQGPSSPGAPSVATGPLENNPVNRPTSSSCNHPPGPRSGAPGRPYLASQQNHYSWSQDSGKQMTQGLRNCPNCWRVPMTIMMQMTGVTICRTWAVHKANCQSAWSKQKLPWSNLPKDGGGHLQSVQQVEESIGSWVSGGEVLVHYPGTKPTETAARWTPALGDSGCRFFGDIWKLADVG